MPFYSMYGLEKNLFAVNPALTLQLDGPTHSCVSCSKCPAKQHLLGSDARVSPPPLTVLLEAAPVGVGRAGQPFPPYCILRSRTCGAPDAQVSPSPLTVFLEAVPVGRPTH
eukprot:scaffold24827_cov112-Isochrysis_galbana.AAC.1